MTELNLPKYNFKIKHTLGKPQIYDEIRRKYYFLTPEEWVRQNFIQYLIQELKFPKGLIAVETGLKVNNLQKRADVVVYNKTMEPFLIVECKAPEVKITQAAFNQIANYNLKFKVSYLVVTNGMNHYVCKINVAEKKYTFIDTLPDFTSF